MQVADAVARMRDSDVQKPPGIAEAIDWLAALSELGVGALDASRGRAHARARCSSTARTRSSSGPRGWSALVGDDTPRLPRARRSSSTCRRWPARSAGGCTTRALPVTAERAAAFARRAGAGPAVSPPAAVLDGARRCSCPTATQVTGVRRRVRRGVRAAGARAAQREDARQDVPQPPDTGAAETIGHPTRRAARGEDVGRFAVLASLGARAEREPERTRRVPVPLAPSDEELLRSKRFDALDAAGARPQLYRLMAGLAAGRRRCGARAAPSATATASGSTCAARCAAACAPAATRSACARRRRRVVPRRMVLLCDISGSMEPYARAYLQFLTCAAGASAERRGVRVRHPADAA